MAERQAKAEREAKEMEGCTFAPTLYTKKKKRPTQQKKPATISLSISENVRDPTAEEEERARELNKFLLD